MIGYIKDKSNFYNGNTVDYLLEKAVTYSGGPEQHYNLFRELLQPSLINNTNLIHDSRAGQFSLHLFPFKLQILLSLLFYHQDNNIGNELNIEEENRNILLPSQQLQYRYIVDRKYTSQNLSQYIDEFIDQPFNDSSLAPLKELFNITESINDVTLTFNENVRLLLSKFRIPVISINQFMPIIVKNDRQSTAILIAQALNYKSQSITYLTEAVNTWLTQTSNT